MPAPHVEAFGILRLDSHQTRYEITALSNTPAAVSSSEPRQLIRSGGRCTFALYTVHDMEGLHENILNALPPRSLWKVFPHLSADL